MSMRERYIKEATQLLCRIIQLAPATEEKLTKEWDDMSDEEVSEQLEKIVEVHEGLGLD